MSLVDPTPGGVLAFVAVAIIAGAGGGFAAVALLGWWMERRYNRKKPR